MKLKDKVAVITGGASGIGEVAAYDLAEHGVKIVVGDVNEEAAKKVVENITQKGGSACYSVGNVTEEKDVKALMDKALSEYGQINVVLPSAGVIRDGLMVSPDRETGKIGKFMSLEDFRLVVDINLVGTFLTLREAAIRMIDNHFEGVLFTMASVQKVGGVGQLNYSSTKAAVAMWPKLLVGEFNMRNIDYIRVVGISPGYVNTAMVQKMNEKAREAIIKSSHIGRLSEPSEIASAIRFCIENDAMDGTTLEVQGGVISGMIAK